ncbi:NAD(P)-dependent alcohol dehydrogenase [uncultured Sphingomonas sp.]|uniref:NAD(P)-dependent alcohol dehydrogenase n=1 Tax=uncultured Sphingomonas sp. TaxID=158754 RepID=UPI0035CA49C4
MTDMPSSVRDGFPVSGLAAMERDGPLVHWQFQRRALRPADVAIDILFCGICHSDLHAIGKWGQEFPLVPGHEIVGRVTDCGDGVTGFKRGDIVAVGTVVDSCRVCAPCLRDEEPYCLEFPTTTYDGVDRVDGTRTRGGFSTTYVCDERFVHHLPDGLDPAGAAPLVCAGITTYSALRHWDAGPGKRIGVIGIGGLGHLAIKFASAMGAEVVAFTRSADKAREAKRLGADEVVLSTDPVQMRDQAHRIDVIIDTVSDGYPMDPYLQTLTIGGTLVSLGIPDAFDAKPYILAMARRSIASSGVGGTREVREMLEFCAARGITADVEIVRPDQVDEALARLAAGDVRYRFVMDMQAFE